MVNVGKKGKCPDYIVHNAVVQIRYALGQLTYIGC